jgi:hypothetical protein
MARIAFAILRSKTVYREITTACNEIPVGVLAPTAKSSGERAFR